MVSRKILVVDDEPKIIELVRLYLEKDGHRVVEARDGEGALAAFRREQPDLVVLDLMLPGVDGLEVCRSLRKQSSVPIVMLTARVDEVDKLIGLELGADDYVTKPFSPRELAARVRAVLRRAFPVVEEGRERIEMAGLLIDDSDHIVLYEDRPVPLTPTEFRLLWALAARPGRVFSRPQLLAEARGDSYEGYERTVDAHVKNLKAKLSQAGCPTRIETVYGVGYRLVEAGGG